MDELEAKAALVRAKGDQVTAALREDFDAIDRVARADSDTWSPNDIRLIRFVLLGVTGLILEGRI